MKRWPCVAAALVLLSIQLAHATMTQLPGIIREPLRLDVTLPDGTRASLEALVTRPDRPGRFPLAMINHGLPRDGEDAVRETPEAYSGPAIVFAQHGYAAMVVNRRGFGFSSGLPDLMVLGACSDRDYGRVGHAWAADIVAALASLRHEPWVEPDRVVLIGHSAGGFAALSAATDALPGVIGIIDFAGGIGSPREGFVCQPERLLATMHDFGTLTHIPSLWIFARNDGFFAPAIARQMFDAYTASGAPAQFDAAPPFDGDGHLLIFSAAFAPWWPRVAAFLDELHLPIQPIVELPSPAALPDPPGLDARGERDFASYVTSLTYEKAFATDGKGHYGRIIAQRTQEDAEAAALEHCRRRGWACSIYAVGNTLAAKP